MDIAVVSSREEGFSNALLEALEAGLPVVATDVGGNREALEDGRFGLLVPSRDASALAEGINTMIANLNHWRKVASEAPRRVRERYSIESMVGAHLELYASATGTVARPTPSHVK
jgi:glycosyltransferase involved in cell wall biosynthesis